VRLEGLGKLKNAPSLFGTVRHLLLPTPRISVYDSPNSDSIPDNSLFDSFHLLTGHSTGTDLSDLLVI
jgi:hypothetical protein